jgi:chromosome segregation ATPase
MSAGTYLLPATATAREVGVTDLTLEEIAVEQPSIDAAIRRLTAALDELEAVVDRRQEHDRGQDNLAARIQALGADRSRLADELDHSMSRSRTLEDANRNIAERIDGAIETIRAVLKSEQQP